MSEQRSTGITRRGLLVGAALGLAAGTPLAWLGLHGLTSNAWPKGVPPCPFSPAPSPAMAGMPGRYPGTVVEVHNAAAVSADYQINADAVKSMVGRGMKGLCDCDD